MAETPDTAKILDLGANNMILENRYPRKNLTPIDIEGPGVHKDVQRTC